jgi:hypothetical protein
LKGEVESIQRDVRQESKLAQRIVLHGDVKGRIVSVLSFNESRYVVELDKSVGGGSDRNVRVEVGPSDIRVDPTVGTSVGQSTTRDPLSQLLISQFFSDDNPVMKSFSSVAGQGLAGFVTNMSFDWNPVEMPWETTFGRRAPKVVKIDMSFSPVHDIAPGLDEHGYNRAPVYVVGDHVRNVVGDVRNVPLDDSRKVYDETRDVVTNARSFTRRS